MLKSITLRFFQPWEKLKLDLDPLVTTLVAPSDTGKSSVLRALGWLATNRPLGDWMLRHGADYCYAAAEFDDAGKIKREKNGGENRYVLDGREYHSFGAEVPETVAAALNLGDVNFQSQLDPPFWLSLTPAQLSRELNAVVDLESIDAALAGVASRLRQARAKSDVARERLSDAERQRDALAWVGDAAAAWEKVEKISFDLERKRYESRQLEAIIERAERLEEQAVGLEGLEKGWRRVAAAHAAWREKVDALVDLETLIDEAEQRGRELCEKNDELVEAERELEKATGGRCPVCQRPLSGR